MYDVIIIGAGMAGMTAAIYTKRRNLKTLILSVDLGGQMSKIADIENWPGSPGIDGMKLSQITKEQTEKLGVEFKFEQAISIVKKDKLFEISTTANKYQAKGVILAFGKVPRTMDIPGEAGFLGKGVSYCVTCDGPFFKGLDVAVVGGGNAALDAVVLLSGIARKVYLIHRRDELRADDYMIGKAKEAPNVEFLLNEQISEIHGDERVKSITLKSGKSIELSGVFIEVGYIINNSLVKDLLECDDKGQIKVDVNQQTSVPGIFAAGDMTDKPFQQLVIAAGEGAVAALSTYDYIQKNF